MGIWIEFRCENREQPSAKAKNGIGPRCESHDNNGPMELAGDTQTDVVETLRFLTGFAKEKCGWVKTKDGWICEYCAKQLGLTPNSN